VSVLQVHTQPSSEGGFEVKWKWKTNPNSRPTVGSLHVTLDESHAAEQHALAEIKALHYLLEERKIHGNNRLGNEIRVLLSSGIIRKALLKGALKVQGAGKADSQAVASAATFLATKYFEASYEVQRWKDEEPKAVEPLVEIHLGKRYPMSALHCELLGSDVIVTRHAMHRWVARICEGLDRYSENDLSKLPDSRWSQAWRWFVNVLSHKGLLKADLLPNVAEKFKRRYGPSCVYLHFSDAMAVLVLVEGAQGYDLVTVLRTNPHVPLLAQQRYMAGQQIKLNRGIVG
jgi:hypothetical protein